MTRGLSGATLGLLIAVSTFPAFPQQQPIPVRAVVIAMFERALDTGDQPVKLLCIGWSVTTWIASYLFRRDFTICE